MATTAKFSERPWIAPEVCPDASRGNGVRSELRGSIERAAHALDHGSIGAVINALLAVRAALRARVASDEVCGFGDHAVFLGPWKRRLRRRYEASLCSIQRLLDRALIPDDRDALDVHIREELARLQRLASLEDQAVLEQHWTDLGVGD